MAAPIPYIHYLVKFGANGTTGWYAPAELRPGDPSGGGYVVPVSRNGRFHRQYQCDVVHYASDGTRHTPFQCPVFVETSGKQRSFVFQIGQRSIIFREAKVGPSERALRYAGRLRHPDFAGLLVEIEPEDPDVLDQLLSQEGLVIVGCEPHSHYEGINDGPDRGKPAATTTPEASSAVVNGNVPDMKGLPSHWSS